MNTRDVRSETDLLQSIQDWPTMDHDLISSCFGHLSLRRPGVGRNHILGGHFKRVFRKSTVFFRCLFLVFQDLLLNDEGSGHVCTSRHFRQFGAFAGTGATGVELQDPLGGHWFRLDLDIGNPCNVRTWRVICDLHGVLFPQCAPHFDKGRGLGNEDQNASQ